MTETVQDSEVVANVNIHLQLCRDRYDENEARNKNFTARSMQITLFGATLFAISPSQAESICSQILIWGIVGCVIAMAAFTIMLIIRPQEWKHPFELQRFSELTSELDDMSFSASIANTYMLAIDDNTAILNKKASWLTAITIIAAGELVLFLFLAVLA